MPDETRTKLDLDPGCGRRRALHRRSRNGFAHDRNEVGHCRRCRCRDHARQVLPHGPSPAEYLLRADLPASRNLRYTGSWKQGLRDDPRLLIRRPAPPPARSRQNLNAAEFTLRVIANVKHKDSSKPSASAKPSTSMLVIEEERQSTAYGEVAGRAGQWRRRDHRKLRPTQRSRDWR